MTSRPADRPTRGRARDRLRSIVAKSIALGGMAVAVPLLTLVGSAEPYFSAHRAGRGEVLLFALAVLVVPAAIAFVLLMAGRATSRSWVVDAVVGLLATVVVVPAVGSAVGGTWPGYLAVAVATAVIVGVAHARSEQVRRFVSLIAIGPLAVVAWFLLLSSVATLVLPAAAATSGRARQRSNVLFVVFDELPLAALLDGEGTVNARRYPNIAELAERSTWYRNATTVSAWTHLAVPSMLSGRMPSVDATANRYANNIFTMLGATHELVPMEAVTHLCRQEACGETSADTATLVDDSWILYAHTRLPRDLARQWLPPVGDRWSDFRAEPPDGEVLREKEERTPDDVRRFDGLVDSVRAAGRRPTAWVAHFRLPHLPAIHLPDGRTYDTRSPGGLARTGWTSEEAGTNGRMRFVLQARYVDELVGRLTDALEAADIYDDTMVVLASDHGITFREAHRRGVPYNEQTAVDVLPVPLFVKYPGQDDAVVDGRRAQVVDIVPTIADALDVALPPAWRFDGVSLADEDRPASSRRYIDGRMSVEPPAAYDVDGAARTYIEAFGEWRGDDDTFAWGPHHRLVGRSTDGLSAGGAGVRGRLYDPDLHTDVDTDAPTVPALVRGGLVGDIEPGEWVAVALGDTVAGVGLTYAVDAGKRFSVTVSPRYLRDGRNDVSLYRITEDDLLERIAIAQ